MLRNSQIFIVTKKSKLWAFKCDIHYYFKALNTVINKSKQLRIKYVSFSMRENVFLSNKYREYTFENNFIYKLLRNLKKTKKFQISTTF